MTQGKCPICAKAYQIETLSDLPTYPFCSPRCRLLDLGRWIDGAYAIPGPEAPTPLAEGSAAGDEDLD